MIPLLVGLLLAQSAPGEPQVFLHQFDLEDRTGAAFDPANPKLRLTLELSGRDDVAFLSERLGKKPARPGTVVVDGLGYRGGSDPVDARYKAASFVLDFDEKPVAAVIAQVRKELGDKPSVEQLIHFVERYIEKKDLSRGYDVASVVATRKQGDCSEHAVLLAALLRAFGQPARVVHGLAIVPMFGKVQAFGHAWVEVHQGKQWQVADAALGTELPRAYLPMSALSNEGVGFGLSALSSANLLYVKKLVLELAP